MLDEDLTIKSRKLYQESSTISQKFYRYSIPVRLYHITIIEVGIKKKTTSNLRLL